MIGGCNYADEKRRTRHSGEQNAARTVWPGSSTCSSRSAGPSICAPHVEQVLGAGGVPGRGDVGAGRTGSPCGAEGAGATAGARPGAAPSNLLQTFAHFGDVQRQIVRAPICALIEETTPQWGHCMG